MVPPTLSADVSQDPAMTAFSTTALPLHRGAGARRHHRLSLRDRTEVTAVLESLTTVTEPGISDLRVLELACGSGRLTLPLATAGHRVLATDIDPQALVHLAAELAQHTRAVERIELRTADMTAFSFEESFKAVCLSTSSVTQVAPEERSRVLERAADHLAPGGALIVCTEYLLDEAPAMASYSPDPRIRLDDEADQDRRRVTLTWGDERYASELFVVPPAWISRTCKKLGLIVTYQHSRPDPVLPGRANAVVAAVKAR